MAQPASSPDFPCSRCAVRDSAICGALSDGELKALSQITTEVTVPAGQTVFYEGDESTYLFNVVSGCLRLSKMLPNGKRQITGFLFGSDFLGLSIAGAYPYSADAITPSTLCRFPRMGLMKLLEEYPKLEHRLLALASNELAEAQEHITLLGRKNASEKIATMLLRLSGKLGRKTDDGIAIDAPMSREDMADYLGLTIETVSRVLSKMRRRGLIRLPEPRHIEIMKPDELELIAASE